MKLFRRRGEDFDEDEINFRFDEEELSLASEGSSKDGNNSSQPRTQDMKVAEAQDRARSFRNMSKPRYGIQDALQLMRSLPSKEKDVVVSIVQRTLASASIEVGDIMKDASTRLKILQRDRKKLSDEIKQLQAGISEKEKQQVDIAAELKEINAFMTSFASVLPSSQLAPSSPSSPSKLKSPVAGDLPKD